MAVVFHRFQKETPATWRPEGARSHFFSIALQLIAAIGVACLFTLVIRFNVGMFAIGFSGALCFAIAIWAALALPILLESAVYINLHPLVVVGQLLSWLSTSALACLVTAWWLRR
ncbi:MAG: hypothetical protein QOI04_957 [Verrucomicrobiota bacterium]